MMINMFDEFTDSYSLENEGNAPTLDRKRSSEKGRTKVWLRLRCCGCWLRLSTVIIGGGASFSAANGQSIFESVDAGDSLSTALVVPFIGQLPPGYGYLLIHGSTAGEANPVDIYSFPIVTPGPVHFAASVSGFDTQLWLFDANGLGLLGNDDYAGVSSLVDTDLAEGGPIALNPGIYYLAVSGWNNDPLSAGGLIFNQQSFTQISIADGPGGSLPLSGWTGGGFSGAYTIGLNFAPIPAGPGFALLGIGALATRRRRTWHGNEAGTASASTQTR